MGWASTGIWAPSSPAYPLHPPPISEVEDSGSEVKQLAQGHTAGESSACLGTFPLLLPQACRLPARHVATPESRGTFSLAQALWALQHHSQRYQPGPCFLASYRRDALDLFLQHIFTELWL